jgi:DNA-binding transcriptional regulator YiaG
MVMDQKIEETIVNKTLGFPVEVRQAPMRRMRGEWVFDVAPRRFQDAVLWKLIVSPSPLSGHHVRLMRTAIEKTMEALGGHLGVSAAAVSKWEDKGEQPTQMNKATEALLRLLVAQTLLEQSGLSPEERDSVFHRVYEELMRFSLVGEPEAVTITGEELDYAEQSPAGLPFELRDHSPECVPASRST